MEAYGPMTLVRRRGWTSERVPAAVEPEPAESDIRASRVAGLRAFADLLATRPDVPVPYSIDGQVGFRGEEGLDVALRLAASFDVELGPPRDTQHPEQRWARSGKVNFGGGVTLTLYVHGLDPVEGEPAAEGEATS
jgi:hypothetical protein